MLTSELASNSYAGDGSTSVYPFTFKVFAAADLLVTRADPAGAETELVLDTDYTVSGVGEDTGGNVLLAAGNLAAGHTLVIERALPLTQGTSYPASGPFPSRNTEQALDRQMMALQQVNRATERAMKLPTTTDLGAVATAFPKPEAGAAIGWNEDGDGLINNPSLSTINSAVSAATSAQGAAEAAQSLAETAQGAAELARGLAESASLDSAASAAEAAGYAAGLHLPAIGAGDAGKGLKVTGAEDGWEIAEVALADGDTWTGSHDMTGATVSVATPTAAAQAANKAYVDTMAAAGNRIVDGGCRIADISAPGVSGSRRFGAPTMFAAWADGSPSAGIIGQGLVAWSASGKSIGVAGLTQTGAGSAVYFSHRIEGQSIADLAGKAVAFACKVHHDTGAAIDWIVTLNSADAADNFSAVTQITSSSAQSVENATATEITLTATLSAAAANGLEIIVTAQCGAVTSTDFYVSDWRLYQGGSCPPMALLPMATERARVARYFRHGTSAAGSQDDLLFSGDVTSGNTYWAQVQFGVPMRATPAVAVAHVGASGFAAATGSVYQNARGIAEQRTATGTVAGGHFASTWTADARL